MVNIVASTGEDGLFSRQMKRVLYASVIGSVIEWYDFVIYGTAAALVFNHLFFPAVDPAIGVILSLGTYAVGYFSRPLGGVLFGHFGDKQRQQEHFTGLAVDEALFPPYTIELRRSGKTIPVRSGQTPLQALLEADVYVDHACEGGICGACSVPWCDGEPIHRDKVLSPDERKRRVILCVAGCRSEKLE